MVNTSAPVLVYNRIDENRRNTFLLLPAFVVLLLPVAYGLTQLLVPFSFYRAHVTLGGAQARLNLESMEASTLRTVLLALVLATCIAFLGYLVSTYFVLRRAGAHRVDRGEEPALCRTVENLCIGAGLPQPVVYVLESSTPNAFSTGRDPKHASIVVTRGLLRLLNERELSGVLAHELSHIGNRDTGLSNLLAAFVATLRLPLDALRAFVSSISKPDPLGFLVMGCGLLLLAVVLPTVVVWSMWARHVDGMPLNVKELMTLVTPVYVFFIAPAAGTFVRKTILHQREFLADADAVLLTRDPEALALALAKVGGATGCFVNAGVATAHLYFVDPIPCTESWFDSTFPSHPLVKDRIALLARMGDGIPDRALLEAATAGITHLLPSVPHHPGARESDGGRIHQRLEPVRAFDERIVPGTQFRLTDHVTPLYEKPDGWSRVTLQLSSGTIVAFDGLDGHFARVEIDRMAGYIPCLAGAVRVSPE
jgi:heat shock protein HtpX